MTRTVASGSAIISYSVEGPAGAPVLLCINSIGSTRALWDPQVAAFRDRFRCVTYDARGHGDSSVARGDYTVDQLGRDAVAILDDLEADTADVCGISLGGLTGIWLGVFAAGRVRRLVLANTAARIGSVASWNERIALVREQGMAAVADRAMAAWFTPPFHQQHPDTVARFRAMVASCPPDGYLGCCAVLRDADLRGRVIDIRHPTLLVASTADAATPPEGLHFLHDRIRGSRLVAFPTAHLSNVEAATEFNAAVGEFLR